MQIALKHNYLPALYLPINHVYHSCEVYVNSAGVNITAVNTNEYLLMDQKVVIFNYSMQLNYTQNLKLNIIRILNKMLVMKVCLNPERHEFSKGSEIKQSFIKLFKGSQYHNIQSSN